MAGKVRPCSWPMKCAVCGKHLVKMHTGFTHEYGEEKAGHQPRPIPDKTPGAK